jgi:hypothetical protein
VCPFRRGRREREFRDRAAAGRAARTGGFGRDVDHSGFEAIRAQKFSDASVRERTGRGWDEWIALRERLTTLKQLLES